MNVRYGKIKGMFTKLNYPLRALNECNLEWHNLVIIPPDNQLQLSWYFPNWSVHDEPVFQFYSMFIISKSNKSFAKVEPATVFPRKHSVRKGLALAQIPVGDFSKKEPTWYVREDDFTKFLKVPYEDAPEGMLNDYSNYPIFADWLEEKRDEDTDYRRKQAATYLLESLRSFINGSVTAGV